MSYPGYNSIFTNIQYVAVTQNVNTILCDCIHIILLTTDMNVNFNKMLETFIFNGLMHSIYIKYTSYKQVIKSGGSSSEHYF